MESYVQSLFARTFVCVSVCVSVWSLIRYGSALVVLWSLYCLRFEMFAFPPSDPSLILCGCLHKQVVVFAFSCYCC